MKDDSSPPSPMPGVDFQIQNGADAHPQKQYSTIADPALNDLPLAWRVALQVVVNGMSAIATEVRALNAGAKVIAHDVRVIREHTDVLLARTPYQPVAVERTRPVMPGDTGGVVVRQPSAPARRSTGRTRGKR